MSQIAIAIANAKGDSSSEVFIGLDVHAGTAFVSFVNPVSLSSFQALVAQRSFSFTFNNQLLGLSSISTTTTTTNTASPIVAVTFNGILASTLTNNTVLQLFIDNLKSVIARAINESSSSGIAIDVNLNTFEVTITFPNPAQAAAFRALVNSGAFIFNFNGQCLAASHVVAPVSAHVCPTVGVNTGNWVPWSTSCGYASRVRYTLNCVTVTSSAYGSYNPYGACNVSCIQSSSYESRSIRCP
jgi:hypothetical protein